MNGLGHEECLWRAVALSWSVVPVAGRFEVECEQASALGQASSTGPPAGGTLVCAPARSPMSSASVD